MRRFLLALALLLLLAVAGAAAVAWWAWREVHRPYQGYPGQATTVVVEPGTASAHILEQLEDRGVVDDALLARLYLRFVLGGPPLQAGEYRFAGAAPAPAVLDKLVRGDVVDHAVTVVEGLTLEETAEALATAGFGNQEALLEAMRDPRPILDLDPEAETLEGYLFPSTYSFRRGTGEEEVVAAMVAAFRQRWEQEVAPLLAARASSAGPGDREPAAGEPVAAGPGAPPPGGGDGKGGGEGEREGEGSDAGEEATDPGAPPSGTAAPPESPARGGGKAPEAPDEPVLQPRDEPARPSVRDIVTLASVVEKEARVEDERPLIAAVYTNRLERGMGLYADPTVIYALKRAGRWDGNIRREDLRIDSPYNTYRHAGLPPGPIASPGLASLLAAAAPADVPYLYFVSRNDGTHAFARTLAEHGVNVERWQRRYWRERRAAQRRAAAGGAGGGAERPVDRD